MCIHIKESISRLPRKYYGVSRGKYDLSMLIRYRGFYQRTLDNRLQSFKIYYRRRDECRGNVIEFIECCYFLFDSIAFRLIYKFESFIRIPSY